jgi:hypothetical protein
MENLTNTEKLQTACGFIQLALIELKEVHNAKDVSLQDFLKIESVIQNYELNIKKINELIEKWN